MSLHRRVWMALGATQRLVARSVLRRGLGLALLGFAVGIVAALAASRFVESFLYGISARDPLSYLVVPVILTAVAALASWLPAWRVSRVIRWRRCGKSRPPIKGLC